MPCVVHPRVCVWVMGQLCRDFAEEYVYVCMYDVCEVDAFENCSGCGSFRSD